MGLRFRMKTGLGSLMVLSVIAPVAMSLAGDQSSNPQPTATPSSTPMSTATPRTSPAASPSDDRPRVGAPLKSQARKFNPPRIEPMPPGTEPGSTAVAVGSASPAGKPVRKHPGGLKRQGKFAPHQRTGASPAEASASPTRALSPSPNENDDGYRSQMPSPTPTPKPPGAP